MSRNHEARPRVRPRLAMALVAVGALACARPAARPGPSLTPEDAARLEALGVPIALPGYMPPGFRVMAVETDAGSGDALQGPTYTIRYARADGACFSIETATGGFGGPVPRSRRAVHAPSFAASDTTPYFVYWTGDEPEPGFRPHSLFSDWIGGPAHFVRLASGGAVPENCVRISPETAVRIVESLRLSG